MSVRALDSDGDDTFGQGRANYISGDLEIAQRVSTRIKSFQFDWFLDYESHIDWFRLLGERNNEQAVLSEIRRVTLGTEGVSAITSLTIESDTRNATISMTIRTDYDSEITQEISI